MDEELSTKNITRSEYWLTLIMINQIEYSIILFQDEYIFYPLLDKNRKIWLMTFQDSEEYILSIQNSNKKNKIDYSAIISIDKSFNLLKKEGYDSDDDILNVINLFDDFLIFFKVKIPVIHQKRLDSLANHLTFNHNLDAFFSNKKRNRQLYYNSFVYLVNAVLKQTNVLSMVSFKYSDNK